MARTDNVMELPEHLPIPQDDGACNHLTGMNLPSLVLRSTRGRMVDLFTLTGTTVVYIYPRTGRPDQELPPGWNAIPGARGCTPQSCAFRDHYQELKQLGVSELFGLSTQDPAYQQEAAERLHLPFELLSDEKLQFTKALQLPTFEVDGLRLIKRITLIARDGRIEKVFFPVFPPDRNADEVIEWLGNPLALLAQSAPFSEEEFNRLEDLLASDIFSGDADEVDELLFPLVAIAGELPA